MTYIKVRQSVCISVCVCLSVPKRLPNDDRVIDDRTFTGDSVDH